LVYTNSRHVYPRTSAYETPGRRLSNRHPRLPYPARLPQLASSNNSPCGIGPSTESVDAYSYTDATTWRNQTRPAPREILSSSSGHLFSTDVLFCPAAQLCQFYPPVSIPRESHIPAATTPEISPTFSAYIIRPLLQLLAFIFSPQSQGASLVL